MCTRRLRTPRDDCVVRVQRFSSVLAVLQKHGYVPGDSFIDMRTIREHRIVGSINKFYDQSGKSINLKEPSSLGLTADKNLMIAQRSQLSAFDTQGKQVKTEKNDKWKKIVSIVAINQDVYLCDKASGTIHKFSSDSPAATSTILIRGLNNPVSLNVTCDKNKLIIGCLNNNNVYVYEIQ